MSLDVYLELENGTVSIDREDQIYIRSGGSTKAVPKDVWEALCPDREPVTLKSESVETSTVFSYNITHNLGKMASAAGVYEYLWRPDEIDISRARDLIQPLTQGLQTLSEDPEKFKQFNPSNGWGDYEGLVEFISQYLIACIKYPTALVSVSR